MIARDLRLLNDILAKEEIAGRYWVWAGLLLGSVREGQVIAHDRDADFAILPEDVPTLEKAVPALRRAGFKPLARYRNNKGEVTRLNFRKHYIYYEFYVFEPVDGMLRYFAFDPNPDHLEEIESQIPNQDLAPFEFLGRSWLRHADYERELELMYGDWRTPQPKWNYLRDDEAEVDRRVWINPDISWPI
ncbi:MAG: hypothetical protein ACHQFZ_08335 [Acidimicrobiales bacterium]